MERITIGNVLGKARIEVGKDLETKINTIVGANHNTIEEIETEKRKIDLAARYGIHTVMDLSTVRIDPNLLDGFTSLWEYGRAIYPDIAFCCVAPTLVSIENGGDVTPSKLLKEIISVAEKGVDSMTLNLIPRYLKDFDVTKSRNVHTTSRQGGILYRYMKKHKVENPYNPILKEIFAIFKEYNITMHVGSTFRPVGISQANDDAHIWEMMRQVEMYAEAESFGVPAIIEPISHHQISDIGNTIGKLREIYGGFLIMQALGPIVTEVNYDSDQYASAIGSMESARYNIGKVTTIPPREHVGFPTLSDVEEGMKAAKIGVHTGDSIRLPYLLEKDKKITYQRGIRKTCNPDLGLEGCNKCHRLCPLISEGQEDYRR